MYREQIDKFIDEKKEEMLEDLKSLVRIDSQKGAARPGKPFGEGPAAALAKGEELMSRYGLKTRNYENYVVAGDWGTIRMPSTRRPINSLTTSSSRSRSGSESHSIMLYPLARALISA